VPGNHYKTVQWFPLACYVSTEVSPPACGTFPLSGSSRPSAADGFKAGAPETSPQRQSFSQSYISILLTFLSYIVPLARGCSPWRPNVVMSTIGCSPCLLGPLDFTGRRGHIGHCVMCNDLPTARAYLRLNRFYCCQAIKQKR
jgi:hypothetical protein